MSPTPERNPGKETVMSGIISKPTYTAVLQALKGSRYGMVRGLVATNGDVFLGNADNWTHDHIAAEAGVEFYDSFMLSLIEDDDGVEGTEVNLDFPAIYHRLKFLHRHDISIATVGIVKARSLSEVD